MPHVAVRATFRHARNYRKDRLLAIKCLNLPLCIDADDKGSVRWGEVKTDDIAHVSGISLESYQLIAPEPKMTCVNISKPNNTSTTDSEPGGFWQRWSM